MWLSYIKQTGHTTAECLKEHDCYIQLRQVEKSGLEEHCVMLRHQPVFESITVLISGEPVLAIQIEPNLVNIDTGLKLDNCCWRCIIWLIREVRVNGWLSR